MEVGKRSGEGSGEVMEHCWKDETGRDTKCEGQSERVRESEGGRERDGEG